MISEKKQKERLNERERLKQQEIFTFLDICIVFVHLVPGSAGQYISSYLLNILLAAGAVCSAGSPCGYGKVILYWSSRLLMVRSLEREYNGHFFSFFYYYTSLKMAFLSLLIC